MSIHLLVTLVNILVYANPFNANVLSTGVHDAPKLVPMVS